MTQTIRRRALARVLAGASFVGAIADFARTEVLVRSEPRGDGLIEALAARNRSNARK